MSEDPEELDMLAGEYVLGSLAGQARLDFEGRLAHDAAARAAVARWADRLAPMADALPVAPPPEGLWRRLDSQIRPRVAPARRGAQGWRTFIGPRTRTLVWGGVGALAALFLVAVLVALPRETGVRPPEAVLAEAAFEGEAGAPRYRILVAADRSSVYVQPSGPSPPGGRVHELWVLEPGGAPRALGLLDPARAVSLQTPPGASDFLQHGAIVAISLEPEGGSPLPGPSGPVLIAATLTAPV